MELNIDNRLDPESLKAEIAVTKVFASYFDKIAKEWKIPKDVIKKVFSGEMKWEEFVYTIHALMHLVNVKNWIRSMVNYALKDKWFRITNPEMVDDLNNLKWNLDIASLLHDLWKTDPVVWALVNSPQKGWFTGEEIEIIKSHPKIWHDMIWKLDNLDPDTKNLAATIALLHHEKHDWTGYPMKLVWDHIPVIWKIAAIIDVFDALTWPRPYLKEHRLNKVDEVLNIMKTDKRHKWQFDPELFKLFEIYIRELVSEKRATIMYIKYMLSWIEDIREQIIELFFQSVWLWDI